MEKKRRFSSESTNDLLFWGVQLAVVAISMALLYSKLENTAQILRALLSEQDSELQIAKTQALKADAVAVDAQRRLDEAEEHRSAFWKEASAQMNNLLIQVTQIQVDVKEALTKSTETNQLVLEAAKESKAAADESRVAAGSAATEATRAAGIAGAAKNAASQAAANSSHTSSVVATKVVTSQDKRSLQAQKAALAVKQQKLSQTIQRVKVKGPNLFEKLLHP